MISAVVCASCIMTADIPVAKDKEKDRTASNVKFLNVIFMDVNSFMMVLFFECVLLYLYDNTEFVFVGYSSLTASLQSDCCYITGMYQKENNFLGVHKCVQVVYRSRQNRAIMPILLTFCRKKRIISIAVSIFKP